MNRILLRLGYGYMALLTSFVLCDRADAQDKLREPLRQLVEGTRTDVLKHKIKAFSGLLEDENASLRRKGVLFFCDIQAKNVLLALLRSDDHVTLVIKNGLDVFGLEDISKLYEVAASRIPETVTTGGEGYTADLARALQLYRRTSAVLGAEFMAPKIPRHPIQGDLRSWWTEVLQNARIKRTFQSDLDTAVKYFEKPARPPNRRPGDTLEEQREALLKQLHSEELKDIVKAKIEWLRPEPAGEKEKRREAVLFFDDIKATGVLAALFHSENKDLKDLMVKECLDVFGVKDVVSLYEGAAVHAKGADANAAEVDLIHKLAKRTAQILRLESTAPKSATAEDVRAWWAQSVRDAQTRGIYQTEIDAALKYFEKK